MIWFGTTNESVPGLRLRIVVIQELPRTRYTLLLRLFGRGQVFADALVDLDELPEDAWERRVMAPLLNDFSSDGKDAETNQEAQVTHAEQMRKLAEVLQRGLVRQGERAIILRQLQVRFGDLPSSVESRVRAAKEADLHLWAERILRARTLEQVFRAPRVSAARKAPPVRA